MKAEYAIPGWSYYAIVRDYATGELDKEDMLTAIAGTAALTIGFNAIALVHMPQLSSPAAAKFFMFIGETLIPALPTSLAVASVPGAIVGETKLTKIAAKQLTNSDKWIVTGKLNCGI